MNKSDGTLTIMTENHNNLTASAADHLSDDELNVMDEVELTVLTVSEIIRLFVSPVRHFGFVVDCIQSFITYKCCVLKVNDTKKAVRLKKLPGGSVTFNQQARGTENISGLKDNASGTPGKDKVF